MKRRNNHFLEQLKQRREAAKSTEEPVPEAPQPELPADPTIRSELLADELRDVREQLAKEREKRQQVERRLEAIETPAPKSMADVLRRVQAGKHKTWR
jgi:hypothetical protein